MMNRSEIFHLIESCPEDNSNPESCPLYEVRKLNPRERIEWVHMLSTEDLEFLSVYCEVCMQCRSNGADFFTPPASGRALALAA